MYSGDMSARRGRKEGKMVREKEIAHEQLALVQKNFELALHDQGKNKVTFAEEMGITPSNVSHIFAGRLKLRMDMLYKMASYVGATTEWLLTEHPPVVPTAASHITTDKSNRKSVNQEG